MEPPSFSSAGPQLATAAPGSDATIALPLPSGSPPFHYEWSHAGAKLGDRFTSSDDAGGVRLTISAAQTGDSGIYTLQASNAAGKDTTRVRLEVSPDEMPTGEDPPTFLRRLQDLTVKVGTRTRFLVEIVSSTECRVTWYRNERRLLEAERIALVRDGNFWCADIAAVSVDDAGRWTCSAENVGGRASCSAHLNVLVPKAYKRPEFVEELRALLTEQGTVSLECKVVGVPTPVLRWFKDSREIKAGDVFALTANAEDPTSLGTYTCEAVNCMGRAYSSSKVHVVGRASREGSSRPPSAGITPEPPPIFTKELEDQLVRICEPLTLSCHIVVPPWPRSVVWYNKEGKVEASDKYHILEDGVGGYLLEVQLAEWPDEGEWKCVATSSGGRIGISTCYVSMDVPKNYRKPRFMENLQAVLTEEGLVSFECKVVGFPTPVLSWFKDGQELKPGDVYQLTGTNSLGSYCCIARNCMGQASSSAELTVEDIQNQLNEEEKLQLFSKNQAPKFLQGLKSVEAKIDEPFRFTIRVAIPPEPTVLWYRDDQPVDESSRCHHGKEERGVFFLDIQNLEFMDQAEWKCVAMNDYGHSVTSCFLKLIIPRHYKKPRFLENLQAILSDEGAVNLECKVIGVPQPILKWYKDGEELKPGDIHRIISGQDGTCCLGTYTCEAQNCMGIAASSASLLGFEDSMKAKNKKKADEQALQRNLSLSTIHEERTSQMYDTPIGDITLDEKGEISFSFDGKEVSVSLYETPDLTEEEALQIVEMYADQLSENVTEHNVVELPPLRFVKETSTSGNLLMEAIIIDVSPEYFTSPEEDLRTEADIEDISIADENGPPQLSLDQEVDGEDYLEKTIALISDERADFPKKFDRKKSDSQKSGDDYFSLSRDQSLSEEKKEDETQMLSESEMQSFESARSTAKPKSKSSKPSLEDGQESSDITKTVLLKEELQTEPQDEDYIRNKPKPDRRRSRSSRRSSSSSEKSIGKIKQGSLEKSSDIEKPSDIEKSPKEIIMDQEAVKIGISKIGLSLSKTINEIQIIERDIILKSELMSTAATASKSLEIINSLITPLSEIHSITDAVGESVNESPEVISSLFNRILQPLNILQQSLTIIEKCIDVESENKTLVKKTCALIIEKCSDELNEISTTINKAIQGYPYKDDKCAENIEIITSKLIKTVKSSAEIINREKNKTQIVDTKHEELQSKHLNGTQKAIYEIKNPLKSLLCIIEAADAIEISSPSSINNTEVILNDMSAPIQDLQTALEQIESLSVLESTTNLKNYNTNIIETVMDSILKLRTSFEELSAEAEKSNNIEVLNNVFSTIKHNIHEISSHIDVFEESIGTFNILSSENKLEVLQKMAQILITLENNLPMLDIIPNVKNRISEFHRILTKLLENVIESNDAKKYYTLMDVCDGVNRINSSLKNLDTNTALSLASISNTLKIIKLNIIQDDVFETNLNISVLSNITDALLSIQEANNIAEECSLNINVENTEDISIREHGENKANVVLEHIEQTLAAMSSVLAYDTTKDLLLKNSLSNISPILEEMKICIASLNLNRPEHDETISNLNELPFEQAIAHPLSELHRSVNIINQEIYDNITNHQESSQAEIFAEPLLELRTTLEILQHDVISQYGDMSAYHDISSSIANVVENIQSCIVIIQDQGGIEVIDEMSTLEDISGIKTTAEILPGENLSIPTTAEITAEELLSDFQTPVTQKTSAQTLQSLKEHITVLQNPDILEALNSLSDASEYSSVKSVVKGLEEIHTHIEQILHPLMLETSQELFDILDHSKIAVIIQPLQEIQQSLSVFDMSDIPIVESAAHLTTETAKSLVKNIISFKSHLDECLNLLMPAIEVADTTFDISNKIDIIRILCENLKMRIKEFKCDILVPFRNASLISLDNTVSDLLDATSNPSEINIAKLKNVTEKLYGSINEVYDDIIQFAPHESSVLTHEATVTEVLDEIEKNIATLEQYHFVDLSHASDIDITVNPQIAVEIKTESLKEIDLIVENAKNIIHNLIQDPANTELHDIEDYFNTCKNEIILLQYLIKKRAGTKKLIKLLQIYYSLCNTLKEFKSQHDRPHLSESVDKCLANFFKESEEYLKNIQLLLIEVIDSQSQVLFYGQIEKINMGAEYLDKVLNKPEDLPMHQLYIMFINLLRICKPCFENIQATVIEELLTSYHIESVLDAEAIKNTDLILNYLNDQLVRPELRKSTKDTFEKIYYVIQDHADFKDAFGTGKVLILMDCICSCLEIFKLSEKDSATIFEKENELKMLLIDMSGPIDDLSNEIINAQIKTSDGTTDVPHIASIKNKMEIISVVNDKIEQFINDQSNIEFLNTVQSFVIKELCEKTNAIINNITTTKNIQIDSRPIEDLNKNLHRMMSSQIIISNEENKDYKEKTQALLQHMEHYIEIIEIVEEVSTIVKLEDFKDSAKIVRELRESIAANDKSSGIIDSNETLQVNNIGPHQAELAQKLQKALSTLQTETLDREQEFSSTLDEEVRQQIIEVVTDLQNDLIALTENQICLENIPENLTSIQKTELITNGIEKTDSNMNVLNDFIMKEPEVVSEQNLLVKHSEDSSHKTQIIDGETIDKNIYDEVSDAKIAQSDDTKNLSTEKDKMDKILSPPVTDKLKDNINALLFEEVDILKLSPVIKTEHLEQLLQTAKELNDQTDLGEQLVQDTSKSMDFVKPNPQLILKLQEAVSVVYQVILESNEELQATVDNKVLQNISDVLSELDNTLQLAVASSINLIVTTSQLVEGEQKEEIGKNEILHETHEIIAKPVDENLEISPNVDLEMVNIESKETLTKLQEEHIEPAIKSLIKDNTTPETISGTAEDFTKTKDKLKDNINELLSEEVDLLKLSPVIKTEHLEQLLQTAKELNDQTDLGEQLVQDTSKSMDFVTPNPKLILKLQEAVSVVYQVILESNEELQATVDNKVLQNISDVLSELDNTLQLAVASSINLIVTTSQLVEGEQKEEIGKNEILHETHEIIAKPVDENLEISPNVDLEMVNIESKETLTKIQEEHIEPAIKSLIKDNTTPETISGTAEDFTKTKEKLKVNISELLSEEVDILKLSPIIKTEHLEQLLHTAKELNDQTNLEEQSIQATSENMDFVKSNSQLVIKLQEAVSVIYQVILESNEELQATVDDKVLQKISHVLSELDNTIQLVVAPSANVTVSIPQLVEGERIEEISKNEILHEAIEIIAKPQDENVPYNIELETVNKESLTEIQEENINENKMMEYIEPAIKSIIKDDVPSGITSDAAGDYNRTKEKLKENISELLTEEVDLLKLSPAVGTEHLEQLLQTAKEVQDITNLDEQSVRDKNLVHPNMQLILELQEAISVVYQVILESNEELQATVNNKVLQNISHVLSELDNTLQLVVASSVNVIVPSPQLVEGEQKEETRKNELLHENLASNVELETENIESQESLTELQEENINDSKIIDYIEPTIKNILKDDATPDITSDVAEDYTTLKDNAQLQEDNSLTRLEKLLQDVNDNIDLSSNIIRGDDSDVLQNMLEEVQTVVMKLKAESVETINDAFNETLEDLECSVRSVQLQINEQCPPELLKEACSNLQVLVSYMCDAPLSHHKNENEGEIYLKNCSDDAAEAIELLDKASHSESQCHTGDMISNLNAIKDMMKFLRINFLCDADTLIVRGIDVVQNLNQIEDKIFYLEKDIDANLGIDSVTRDSIISAIHSVYQSISNMRGTLSTIQKKYMYENYGKPSECFLKSIKNVGLIQKYNENPHWKQFSKSLRKVLNHFEDIKFYINLDKTARLPSDAAFTKIILDELCLTVSEFVIPNVSFSNKLKENVMNCLDFIKNKLNEIENRETLEVKEKIPIFKDLSKLLLNTTEIIKKEVEKMKPIDNLQQKIEDENMFESAGKEPEDNYQIITEIQSRIPESEIQQSEIQSKIETNNTENAKCIEIQKDNELFIEETTKSLDDSREECELKDTVVLLPQIEHQPILEIDQRIDIVEKCEDTEEKRREVSKDEILYGTTLENEVSGKSEQSKTTEQFTPEPETSQKTKESLLKQEIKQESSKIEPSKEDTDVLNNLKNMDLEKETADQSIQFQDMVKFEVSAEEISQIEEETSKKVLITNKSGPSTANINDEIQSQKDVEVQLEIKNKFIMETHELDSQTLDQTEVSLLEKENMVYVEESKLKQAMQGDTDKDINEDTNITQTQQVSESVDIIPVLDSMETKNIVVTESKLIEVNTVNETTAFAKIDESPDLISSVTEHIDDDRAESEIDKMTKTQYSSSSEISDTDRVQIYEKDMEQSKFEEMITNDKVIIKDTTTKMDITNIEKGNIQKRDVSTDDVTQHYENSENKSALPSQPNNLISKETIKVEEIKHGEISSEEKYHQNKMSEKDESLNTRKETLDTVIITKVQDSQKFQDVQEGISTIDVEKKSLEIGTIEENHELDESIDDIKDKPEETLSISEEKILKETLIIESQIQEEKIKNDISISEVNIYESELLDEIKPRDEDIRIKEVEISKDKLQTNDIQKEEEMCVIREDENETKSKENILLKASNGNVNILQDLGLEIIHLKDMQEEKIMVEKGDEKCKDTPKLALHVDDKHSIKENTIQDNQTAETKLKVEEKALDESEQEQKGKRSNKTELIEERHILVGKGESEIKVEENFFKEPVPDESNKDMTIKQPSINKLTEEENLITDTNLKVEEKITIEEISEPSINKTRSETQLIGTQSILYDEEQSSEISDKMYKKQIEDKERTLVEESGTGEITDKDKLKQVKEASPVETQSEERVPIKKESSFENSNDNIEPVIKPQSSTDTSIVKDNLKEDTRLEVEGKVAFEKMVESSVTKNDDEIKLIDDKSIVFKTEGENLKTIDKTYKDEIKLEERKHEEDIIDNIINGDHQTLSTSKIPLAEASIERETISQESKSKAIEEVTIKEETESDLKIENANIQLIVEQNSLHTTEKPVTETDNEILEVCDKVEKDREEDITNKIIKEDGLKQTHSVAEKSQLVEAFKIVTGELELEVEDEATINKASGSALNRENITVESITENSKKELLTTRQVIETTDNNGKIKLEEKADTNLKIEDKLTCEEKPEFKQKEKIDEVDSTSRQVMPQKIIIQKDQIPEKRETDDLNNKNKLTQNLLSTEKFPSKEDYQEGETESKLKIEEKIMCLEPQTHFKEKSDQIELITQDVAVKLDKEKRKKTEKHHKKEDILRAEPESQVKVMVLESDQSKKRETDKAAEHKPKIDRNFSVEEKTESVSKDGTNEFRDSNKIKSKQIFEEEIRLNKENDVENIEESSYSTIHSKKKLVKKEVGEPDTSNQKSYQAKNVINNNEQLKSEKSYTTEKPLFVDRVSMDYELDFAKPSSYNEKYLNNENYFPEIKTYPKNPIVYKAQTLVYESQLRSSMPPQVDQLSVNENRLEIRARSKALSESRSVISEKRAGSTRDLKRKPVFSTFLTDRTAVEGSRVKLTCSILSSSDTTVTWYKNGTLLDNKQKYRTKFIDGLITLEVLNAVPNDSAEYSCTAENEHGSITTSANLKVYPSFEASPIPPTFTRSIRDVYHTLENELILECRIRGQPLPTITWYKNDVPINTGERYQAHYLADGVCRLTICHPTVEDSGKYTCKAENSIWSDHISHVVSFTGKERHLSPNITTVEKTRFNRLATESRRPHFTNVLTDHKVVTGGTIGLQVEIMGSPTRVEWLREGRAVTEVCKNVQTYVDHDIYTLALPDVTEKESGLYTCRAWSSHGNVDMNAAITVVQHNQYEGIPAMIVGRPEKDLLISVGEDLNISFRVQGEPKPKVFFMKGIRDITNCQRVCKMTSDDYVKFTLKRSVVSDAGTYCVFARNAYGCDRAFVTVVIRQRASSGNLVSDWTYPIDDLAISGIDRNYKSVPDRIPSEPSVVDGGNNWVSLAWPKPEPSAKASILAYKVECWLLGKEGGARWIELGITPRNSFDAFNLKQGEEYHFRVTPRNRYGWGESVQTSTPIGIGLAGDRPEFIEILPGQLKVLVGETATLSCSFKGKPTPEIVWMKNGHEVEEDPSRVRVALNSNDTSLRIEDVTIEDEGRYSCEATNIHGRSSTYARMAVITDRLIWEADAKLKRERSAGVEGDYPPQFTMRLRDRRVQATYPVRLTCQVVGNPPPTLTWFKNGEQVSSDSRHTTSQDEYFHTLEIAPTTLEDGGVYEAMARNGCGAISCRCSLVVDKGIRAYVAPEFCCGLEPLYRLSEGEELRISAVVEAYPSVGVTWYRDGVRLRPSRRAVMTLDRDGQIELALASITPRDAGVYTCTASNEVGRASTSGKVEVVVGEASVEKPKAPPILISPDVPYSKEPMFIRKPRSSEAYEGDTVIIECEVIGDPKPDVYWLRDFLKPDYYRDASHFKRVGAGPGYRFEIPHAKLDYTGAYSVVARNVHGEAKAIISLQILAKDPSTSDDTHNIRYGRVEVIPRFEKELTDLLCYDGDAVEFECRVSGNPEPNIRWFHYNEIVADCPDFEPEYCQGAARLKIKQVTADDEGTYICEAANSLGKATSSACLVVYPPGEPNTLSQRLRRPPALLSAASTPRSTPRTTPRTTPARSVSRTPGPESRRLCSPSREISPKFYTYPYNKVVEEGDTVVFQCAVKGLPPPWATWDKDGIIITPSARISVKEKDEMFRILEIEQVSIEDVGLYRITLENDYGRAEASARLEVISQKGKFHATTRSYSVSPRKSLPYRRRTPSLTRQD